MGDRVEFRNRDEFRNGIKRKSQKIYEIERTDIGY